MATKSAINRLRGGVTSINEQPGSGIATPGEVALIENADDLALIHEEAGSRMVVVDFFAEWCGPCKKIAPLLHQLAQKAGDKVVFCKVDVDASRELAASHGVKSMPTILFFREGKQTDQIVGADSSRLRELVARAVMHPLLRIFSSDKLLAAGAALYVLLAAEVSPLRLMRGRA